MLDNDYTKLANLCPGDTITLQLNSDPYQVVSILHAIDNRLLEVPFEQEVLLRFVYYSGKWEREEDRVQTFILGREWDVSAFTFDILPSIEGFGIEK